MTTTVVVQARMGSTRLPGKVAADVGGRPLLDLMLARLRPLSVERVIVATSVLARDDLVERIALDAGAAIVRGSEHDVLARFAAVLDAYPCDELVRLTADCPLMDPAIVRSAMELHRQEEADYTSNTLTRTFPDGLDVEVIAAQALREAASEATEPYEREHVTPFLYRRPQRYGLATLLGPSLLGDERWTVDTAADLDFVRQVVASLTDPERAGWQEIRAITGSRRSPTAAMPGESLGSRQHQYGYRSGSPSTKEDDNGAQRPS